MELGLPSTAHLEANSQFTLGGESSPKYIFPNDTFLSEYSKGCPFLSTSLNVSAGCARLSVIWLVPFFQCQVPLGYPYCLTHPRSRPQINLLTLLNSFPSSQQPPLFPLSIQTPTHRQGRILMPSAIGVPFLCPKAAMATT